MCCYVNTVKSVTDSFLSCDIFAGVRAIRMCQDIFIHTKPRMSNYRNKQIFSLVYILLKLCCSMKLTITVCRCLMKYIFNYVAVPINKTAVTDYWLESLQQFYQHPLPSSKVTIWCEIFSIRSIGLYFLRIIMKNF